MWHPRAKEKTQQNCSKDKITFIIKPHICQRCSEDTQTKPCVHQDPETTQRLSQTCLWVFECLLQRQGSAVACHRDIASGCSRPGTSSLWYKPSWRRSPLAPPYSPWADDSQTAEQLYQRSSCTVKKVLGFTTDFPPWGSGKGTENPQGIWLLRPVGFDYRTSTGLGKQTLGGHKQKLVLTRIQEKRAVFSQETEPDLPVSVQESPAEAWVSRGLLQSQGHWTQQCGHNSFWRRFSLPSLPPHHSLASGQTTGREHSSTHQQKIGLKIYWAWPHPSEQDPDSRVSLSHQGASTGLLFLSIRG